MLILPETTIWVLTFHNWTCERAVRSEMSTFVTFQEDGTQCPFARIVFCLLLFPPEGANHFMKAVYVLSCRDRVRGWRWVEAETKTAKATDSLHRVSAPGAWENVLEKSISWHGCQRRACYVDEPHRSASQGKLNETWQTLCSAESGPVSARLGEVSVGWCWIIETQPN